MAKLIMNFVKTPDRITGNRIYGYGGKRLLLIRGSRVINGEWDVEWTNVEQTVGRCSSYPKYTFEYMFHAPDGSLDYNEALFAAKAFSLVNSGSQMQLDQKL